ncbi:MAG: cytochrome c biogenesis protein DipZ [Candidatus Levybacteria bacterium]|nr:cytochrome c biogenesis protein DipZ [Candidatus Levybacteria bacterium]
MEVLLLFAFISGLVTIFAPCIWPLLPIILSASSSGGHRKPLGITLGIVLSFAVITLTISYIVKIIPFDPDVLRYFAVAIIGFLGLTLVIPVLSQKLEGAVSRLSGKMGLVSDPKKTGFWSGFLTGFALGIVWTPCAGPILATIATLAATQSVNLDVILVTLVYVIGVGIPLFIFATAGSTLFSRSRFLSKYTGQIQQVFGVIMILTAVSIATGFDKTLQVKLLDAVPTYGNFINQLETNDSVKKELDSLRGRDGSSASTEKGKAAPEFVGIAKWLNTDKPLTIKEQKGKVVLVDIWTYTCINCLRTIPRVNNLYEKYKDDGLVVVGVHSPEFEFEKDTKNVEAAIERFKIKYPVAQDNDFATWNAYDNQYWPAKYLVDANGVIRYTHYGEGNYEETERMIQLLLKEAGQQVNTTIDADSDSTIAHETNSPETYLGSKRMLFLEPQGKAANGTQNFTLINSPKNNRFSFGGQWTVANEYSASGANATIRYNFNGEKVFMVLKKGDAINGKIRVLLDGKVVDAAAAGIDVKNGEVTVTEDRLYEIIDLKGQPQNKVLELQFLTPGVEAYTFTFG